MSDGDWRETANGNWVLPGTEGIEATVYATRDSEWGVVWNGARDSKARRLKKKFDSAENACRAAEAAIREGEQSLKWWPPEGQWQKGKKGGAYRKANGSVSSVKQARSGSWYAVNSAGRLLGQSGRACWFSTEGAARDAVDATASGSSQWSWVPSAQSD
jgi:hypothetical protein